MTREMSCPSIRMLPRCDVVEALQQREQRGFAAAGRADQPDALAGSNRRVKFSKTCCPPDSGTRHS